MLERVEFQISGVVQGVGFRPWIHTLAAGLSLSGFVRNVAGRVHVEVEGPAEQVARFSRALEQPPPLARIEGVHCQPVTVRGERGFRIAESAEGSAAIAVAPDLAPCADCLAELFDPLDRRYRYPFLSCTQCGPRLTIATRAPYDRVNTTMAGFAMCSACRAEYEDPQDRRFHAQTLACPACGPQLELPLEHAIAALREGKIVAVKGAGGWHLACDARSEAAVTCLRQRKRREEKPFALMVGSLDAARTLGAIDDAAAAQLQSPARPIVLLPALQGVVAASVAPGMGSLGVMLPSTPLHALLCADFGSPLVMTSGNLSDEPIAYRDEDARERLPAVADLLLGHDRPIHIRCDDSVVRPSQVLRRSRGHAPLPIALPFELSTPTLAVGGALKGSFALGAEGRAVLCHHLGDLDQPDAFEAFVAAVGHYQRLFRIAPERIVADLHPDDPAAVWARGQGLELLLVQHHHAHVASCLAEHRAEGPVAAIAFDGAGFGGDGTVWGGEVFKGGCGALERVGSLSAVPLPGGDRASRECWRMAVMRLDEAGLRTDVIAARMGASAVEAVRAVAAGAVNAPLTSSAGRLFDAVASLLGVADEQTFEGQAAMRLEALASRAGESGHYPLEGTEVRPIIGALMADRASTEVRSRRFHSSLAHLVALEAARLGCEKVVLTGGVFQNALLQGEAAALLEARGLVPLVHRKIPPNDGGLALGQLAVAAARDARSS
jgi:hydrogenase maturation protein HypF